MLKFVSKTPSPSKQKQQLDQNKQKFGMYILDLNQNQDNVSTCVECGDLALYSF